MSIEYYSKLERGALAGVSAGVFDTVTDGCTFVRNGRMDVLAANRLARAFYAAEPSSPSEEALRLLASWAASQETDSRPRALSTD
ncbi:hypothetical protein AB0H88_42740 [Nonomuraea sp. NPDC050680]|uniref:hypothetical protein n=1 Tax=Nonomuraea sp. NPDC050680 TaxID=3154630 RepID=UPI0033CDFF06